MRDDEDDGESRPSERIHTHVDSANKDRQEERKPRRVQRLFLWRYVGPKKKRKKHRQKQRPPGGDREWRGGGQYGSLVQWRPEERPAAQPQRWNSRSLWEGVVSSSAVGLWASSTLSRKEE
ncbi:Hypothetical predicted protein [Xyrichtys novacula]|uniref:Uncharacterized protein n=1 Tax=Xyrichtys novacula TaxID=13765 RepID=A0AAV1GT58_XYRNO|nr:Hypothetical predicted protein [Xyrichtys novacula]